MANLSDLSRPQLSNGQIGKQRALWRADGVARIRLMGDRVSSTIDKLGMSMNAFLFSPPTMGYLLWGTFPLEDGRACGWD
jgi:hypothetical protein